MFDDVLLICVHMSVEWFSHSCWCCWY